MKFKNNPNYNFKYRLDLSVITMSSFILGIILSNIDKNNMDFLSFFILILITISFLWSSSLLLRREKYLNFKGRRF